MPWPDGGHGMVIGQPRQKFNENWTPRGGVVGLALGPAAGPRHFPAVMAQADSAATAAGDQEFKLDNPPRRG